jgi:L,D-transpeptidase YcbB
MTGAGLEANWETLVKAVRLSGLAASTALALILALSSQPGHAQSSSTGQAQAPTQASAPSPDAAAKPAEKAMAAPSADKADMTTATSGATASQPATETADKASAEKTSQALPTVMVPLPHIVAPTEKDFHVATPAATASAPTKTPAEAPATTASIPKTTAPADETAPTSSAAAKPATATQQAAVAPVQTPPAVAESAVADALKSMIAGRLDRYVPRKEDRAGIEAFYKKRDYRPLWVANGSADSRAKAASAYLASVAADGLNPSDYPTPNFDAASADNLAAAELELTNSVLIYAHDAQVGRIHFSRVGSDISFKLVAPKPLAVLDKMAETNDVAAALDGYNPPQPGFKALKAKLAALRKGEKTAQPDDKKMVRIPNGRILRPGMKDPRVVLLRKRLDIAGDKSNPVYDKSVIDAVKAFQMKANIGVDGMLGPQTVAALNGVHGLQIEPRDPIETVIVNMERWRWLPRKLSNSNGDYIMVNVPNYTLRLVHDGKTYWKTKIVVGKPSKATPMTTAEMKYITVNPTWHVPPSIIENEYLPALQEDPNALERIGLKIRQDPDGTVHIYQPPGAGNALGRIRFNFPNKFLVYQHDTPDKYLFKRAKRAYSHGCMRVQNPAEYATKLLSLELPQDHYTPAKIESMYGQDMINIDFPNPIPVHLTYQTAFVDHAGKLQFRQDIYGRDRRMIAILKNARERRVAYIPVEHPPNTSSKPVRLPVGALDGDGGYVGPGYGGGPSFFDFLFGGGDQSSRRSYRSYRRSRFIGPDASDNGRYTRR